MTEQVVNEQKTMKLEELVEELKEGSGFRNIQNKELGYYNYESVRLVLNETDAVLYKRRGYDGEEDGGIEWFFGEWECTMPRKEADRILSELIAKGCSELKGAYIKENNSGKKAYNPQNEEKKDYRRDLSFVLKAGQKPVVEVINTFETRNPDYL
jgi:hypothetical protein